jgi:deoxyribodipyrimidine photolyase
VARPQFAWKQPDTRSNVATLSTKGSRLILRRGPADAVLRDVMTETGAIRIHAIRRYEPWWRTAEAALGNALCLHDGNYLVPIEQVRNGAGVDANMFGRIMAPLSQSDKFHAGDYIRQWVREFADLPDRAIHDPDAAGCRPGDYPTKIIGHREGRERASAAARHLA